MERYREVREGELIEGMAAKQRAHETREGNLLATGEVDRGGRPAVVEASDSRVRALSESNADMACAPEGFSGAAIQMMVE